jgi:phage-related minor tail protein
VSALLTLTLLFFLPPPPLPSVAFSYDTNKLEDLLVDIAELIELRNKTLESLKAKTPDESLVCDRMLEKVNSIAAATPLTEEMKQQFIQSELDVFTADLQTMEQTFTRQAELLEQVYQENIFFTNARENDPANVERDRLLKSLEQGTSAYFAYQSQLNAGGVFYRDMQVSFPLPSLLHLTSPVYLLSVVSIDNSDAAM